jgi:hypothetical protein
MLSLKSILPVRRELKLNLLMSSLQLLDCLGVCDPLEGSLDYVSNKLVVSLCSELVNEGKILFVVHEDIL